MPDARVIPFEAGRGDGREKDDHGRAERSRPTGQHASAADAVAAGADRASGERARRRRVSTPLIDPPVDPPADPVGGGAAPGAAPTPAAAPTSAMAPTSATPTSAARRRERAARRTPDERALRSPRPAAEATRRSVPAPDGAVRQADRARVLEQAESVGAELAHLLVDDRRRAPADWERQVASALAFLRRRLTGEYQVDEFGFDRELTDAVLMAAMRPLYRRWFRVETVGMDNVPAASGALLVANHSGTIPVDAVMTQIALLDHHPARRALRVLGADLVFSMPFLGEVARKSGATLACSEDAERLLSGGELVGVWPEGFKGIGKPFRERYKLQRFGRGGFVAAALRTGTPILPCAIVGAEEIYPIIGNLKTVARLLGVPYLPITPTFPLLGLLGLVPLPSKWMIEFGDPIETAHYGPGAADDPMLVFNLTDQVRETIQHTLYKLLMQRRSVFF